MAPCACERDSELRGGCALSLTGSRARDHDLPGSPDCAAGQLEIRAERVDGVRLAAGRSMREERGPAATGFQSGEERHAKEILELLGGARSRAERLPEEDEDQADDETRDEGERSVAAGPWRDLLGVARGRGLHDRDVRGTERRERLELLLTVREPHVERRVHVAGGFELLDLARDLRQRRFEADRVELPPVADELSCVLARKPRRTTGIFIGDDEPQDVRQWERQSSLSRNSPATDPVTPAASIVRSRTSGTLASRTCVSIVRLGSSSTGVWPINVVVAASCRLTRTSADAS